ncbi:MAG: hypothetical protein MI863_10000 [Desulfobacterales bacterium]|nr:hypothetical protein [Desulfobacterales bacterium]
MKAIKVISVLATLLLLTASYGFCEGLKLTPEGNVGIGTTTPEAKLEVNGDILVNGTIKQSKTAPYADWYVGNYYSIPVDQRTAGWDRTYTNLTAEWTTVDLSNHPLLPQGAKRVKVYVDASGIPNDQGILILLTRPFGTDTGKNYQQTAKSFLQLGSRNQPRLALEIEVDIKNGKFEIAELASSWEIEFIRINLRGFYM